MKQTDETAVKKLYVSPTVTVLGDIEAITLMFSTGEQLDADYPRGTHVPGDILS